MRRARALRYWFQHQWRLFLGLCLWCGREPRHHPPGCLHCDRGRRDRLCHWCSKGFYHAKVYGMADESPMLNAFVKDLRKKGILDA